MPFCLWVSAMPCKPNSKIFFTRTNFCFSSCCVFELWNLHCIVSLIVQRFFNILLINLMRFFVNRDRNDFFKLFLAHWNHAHWKEHQKRKKMRGHSSKSAKPFSRYEIFYLLKMTLFLERFSRIFVKIMVK